MLKITEKEFSRENFSNLLTDIFTYYRIVRANKEKGNFWNIGKEFQLITKNYEINKNTKPKIIDDLQDSDFYENNAILFKLDKNNQLYLDRTEETDDGTWPEISDWINFIKNIDIDNDYIYNFYFSKEKNICKFDNFKLIRIDEEKEKSPDFQKLKLIFDKPQKFIFGEIGFGNNKEFITKEISEIYCNFVFEGFWYANDSNAKQKQYCNIIEIYLTDIVFIK